VDSSGYAIAAVLSQPDPLGVLHPVSFFSRKLSDRERGWAIFDLELLAIVESFEQWRAWLMGTKEPVRVYSDHSNLQHFTTSKHLTPKQARWASFLDGFNFVIHHISGKINPANAPSRRPDLVEEGPLIPSQSIARRMATINDMSEQISDPSPTVHDLHFQRPSKKVLEHIGKHYDKVSPSERKELPERNSLLWFQDRIFVLIQLRTRLIQCFHDEPTVGHPGVARTLSLITRSFLWPGIRKDIIRYVGLCDSCQQVKAHRHNPEGTLKTMPIPHRPWSIIGMDFITKLPVSGVFDSIMVVIDLLSKVTHFVPCKETYTAEQIAQIFRSQIFKLHGMPEKIISDRGSTFVSEFWRAFMRSLSITPGFSTAYHPQTDGQTERMNQVLEDYLCHFCSYYQDNWVRILDIAEFSINNLDSASLGTSPFFFANGFHPKFSVLTETSKIRSLDDFIIDLQEIQEKAVECLIQAKRRQALYYNAHKRPATQYKSGDLVLLLRKFIQSRRINSKLDFRYIGPFRVVEMVGKNAVKLDIACEYPKLHPVFNVSLLTKYHPPSEISSQGMLEGIKEAYYDSGMIVNWANLHQILDARPSTGKAQKGKFEFLLRWRNSTPGEDT
jgi:transposase InsO family protein